MNLNLRVEPGGPRCRRPGAGFRRAGGLFDFDLPLELEQDVKPVRQLAKALGSCWHPWVASLRGTGAAWLFDQLGIQIGLHHNHMFDRALETSVDILAPAEVAWAVLAETSAWPEWNTVLVKCQGRLEPGQRLSVTAHMPGRRAWSFKPTVLTVEPNAKLEWRGSLAVPGLFTGRHYFVLEPAGSGACRLVHGEEFSGLLLPLMGGLLADTEKGFHAMNAALKARAEARAGLAQE